MAASSSDALDALKETKCSTGDLDKKIDELDELSNWFDVTTGLLKMEGRVPIRVQPK